jgi:hypothetical protein
MKNAALNAGDALMARAGRSEAFRLLADTLLTGWFGGGNGDAAVLSDSLAMPAMARRSGDGYALHDVASVGADAPCFAVGCAGGGAAFERGLFDLCVSVAYLEERRLMAAVVYDPVHVELFHAVDGLGAYLNGRRIAPAATRGLSDALVSLDHAAQRSGDAAALLREAGHIRVAPACGLELCYAACGRVDAAIRRAEAFYDYAAGLLVAKEAGAVLMDGDGAVFPAFEAYGERRGMAVACGGVALELAKALGSRG